MNKRIVWPVAALLAAAGVGALDDLEDVAAEIREKLEIIPVKKVTDVLERLLK